MIQSCKYLRPLPGNVIVLAGIACLGLFLTSCNLFPISSEEALQRTQIRATELEVNVQQTLLVQKQAEIEIERTVQASNPISPPPEAQEPTLESIDTPAVEAVTTETAPKLEIILPTETAVLEAFDEQAYQAWRKNAKILLYEDMTARLDTVRYVKLSLDELGLPYKDDGSAFGWLQDDLAKGTPDGGQWDLIIMAAEEKNGIKADFFSPALTAIEQGTAVILEVWYLDGTYRSSASRLMAACGIEFENNWIGIPPSGAAMFALNPDHPVMNQPNSALNFTSTTNFWWDPQGVIRYDIGDLVKTASDSNATLLLGTVAGSRTNHGTSTVCMDGYLTWQTFSSHILTFNSMSPLWQNYIENALRTRFKLIQ